MKSQLNIFGLVLIISFFSFSLGYCFKKQMDKPMCKIESIKDIQQLFPTTPQQIQQRVESVSSQAKQIIEEIIAIPDDQRTFENTARALDTLSSLSDFVLVGNVLQILELSSPESDVRSAAHDGTIALQDIAIDYISNNKKLYEVFKSYVQNSTNESLTEEQRYYLDEALKDFKRAGLDLPDDKLEQVRKIKKELVNLELDFDATVAQDKSSITVDKKDLKGVDADFIKQCKQTDDGNFILGVDYPTYFNVMENCEVEDTRKKLYIAFQNRAYPKNEETLKQIVAKRNELAQLLGYKAYNELDLDNQMVQTPERATLFLQGLIKHSTKKEKKEVKELLKELPESVTLTQDGKIKPWDLAYLTNLYKKKHFNINEQVIAEYFPMEKTVKGLLDIYSQFLSIAFEEVPSTGFWHEDVKLIKVYSKDRSQELGNLLLDLFPRPNKYSHAAHAGVIPAVIYPDGTRTKTVSVVWANFPKSTNDKPSLLLRNDVKTFFHEFGHALHAILGATEIGSFSGTSVKRDFVELPSQMLEEWLSDKEMLKKVSGHYKTNEPLSDDIIDNIIKVKQAFSGSFVQRQAILSFLSLQLFDEGDKKDPYQLQKQLYEKYAPTVYYEPNNHMYASFGHLNGYGAKYYGYLWSRVFALDLFDQIKQQGLLDANIGQKYVQEVIGKGGSKDPNTLLQNFLGREPSQDAFLKDLGFMSSDD